MSPCQALIDFENSIRTRIGLPPLAGATKGKIMTRAFRKGDRVKVIAGAYCITKVGTEWVVVQEIDSGGDIKISKNGEDLNTFYIPAQRLSFIEMTLANLAEGDVILDEDGDECHILGIIRPGLYVLEDAYHEGHADTIYTVKELEDNGYTIKQEIEAVVERTVADLEKELKLKPGTLRVKADEAA